MASIRHQISALLLLWLTLLSDAWVSPMAIRSPSRTFTQRTVPVLYSTKTDKEVEAESPSGNSSVVATPPPTASETDEDDDDDDEYEYIEYEMLTEADYLGSEWMVGTLWDNKNDIKETWVRLATKDDKNIAVWGDGSEGTWSLDTASQFLGISKNFLWGKQIWAGVVDDYYFCQGTVRGWTYLTPASVLGQWQAKRLGVDPEEAGTAPWFEEAETEEENKTEKEADTED